jgi:hypothetical protein
VISFSVFLGEFLAEFLAANRACRFLDITPLLNASRSGSFAPIFSTNSAPLSNSKSQSLFFFSSLTKAIDQQFRLFEKIVHLWAEIQPKVILSNI